MMVWVVDYATDQCIDSFLEYQYLLFFKLFFVMNLFIAI